MNIISHPCSNSFSQTTACRKRGNLLSASVLLGVSLLLPDHGQAGFWDVAAEFGKNLLATAAGNYTNKYERDLSQLLQALRQPAPNQPLLQGITQGIMPGISPSPQAPVNQQPYGQTNPYDSNPPYPNSDGLTQGYGQAGQQNGYGGGFPETGYPTDPNYGNVPSGNPNPYPQGQGYNDPYNSQQGYPTQPNYGNIPSDNHNPYNLAQGGNPPSPPNFGNPGYPSQQGMYDQNQIPAPQQPAQPQYAQPRFQPPVQPQYPTHPSLQEPRHPIASPVSAIGQGIQLDVALVKKTVVNGAETMIPIKDGDVLRDGRGKAQVGDKFRIMFRAKTDCYVYVIAIDGSAWAQGVFPSLSAPFANPVKQGQQYLIPENHNWFSLDQFKGIETIFFVASPDKREDIETILASIAGKERNPKTITQQVMEAPIIPAGFHRSQPSATPFMIGQESASPQGKDQGLIPTTYFTQKAGEALRVTRWFRHE